MVDLFLIFRNSVPWIWQAGQGRSEPRMQYFVVMIDYGRRGREAIVDPEVTRREVVSRVASGEYAISASFTRSPMPRSRISPPTSWRRPPFPKSPRRTPIAASGSITFRDLRKHETA